MSELNRMLSDLSSQQNSEKRLAVASIPSVWSFRFARVVLALVATLVGATGISWAVSVGSEKALLATPMLTPEPVFAEPAPKALPSPTQKVVKSEVSYVAMKATPVVAAVEPTFETKAETKPTEQISEPVLMAKVETVKAAPVQEKVEQEASLSVETIELTGEQLADIAYDKAQKRAQVGDTQKAIAFLRDAVKYNPSHIAATNQLAGLLYGRSQLREAENVLRKGISANPNSATLKLTLARMYQQSGSEESALNVLSSSVNLLDGEQVRFVSMRAALAQKLGKNLEAKQSYQWLTEQEPMDGRWWLGLGVSAEKTGANEEAANAYGKAVQSGGLSNQSVNFARQRLVYLQNLKQGATDGR
ncbi:tetratricopeptide repeat protein [Grimontia sp. S25]|uniref:Tetratricopeptide repeat protein n=1 Tax=Grimontia sedimenti TaxID=2711294 RepID=A0A6M1RJ57_9GAMM|nr:tetratricopeptide repeat protein [Grimontia sedimenti]NGN98251.1 tetratricopeptide repeat protein [Grimontia sedimenti]